ncbi:DnaJ/Hsp40 cysteine-rich domain superfamily protein [Striga hermonthica]|uniref:DnaJ/Hsp40 cysteine-rich domain superfamily protein n=1 Tax=Striga hermonthica TaxID=68872 RepID=A0A9N7RS82_STRHE|nr:DnaJ/Hsp40 cysteine-rich domain superfamily protein [Striga hermonthica]
MAAILRVTNSLPRVRSEATCTGNGSPAPPDRDPSAAAWLAPSLPKRSWVVRTESNIRKASIRRPDPPCVVCRGSGRVDCHDCNGKGRTNHVQSTILPKGEWPKWCRKCGGSGLGCCNRCLGTGEYRDIIGFHFMKKGIDEAQNERRDSLRDLAGSYTLTDLLQYKDQLDSGSER